MIKLTETGIENVLYGFEDCDRGIIGFMLMIILVVFTIAGTTITQGLLT